MLEDGSFAMEKKPTRQLPLQSKTSATPDRRSDFPSKQNGRRRWKDNGSPGSKSVEPGQTPTRPTQKWNRGNSDKRPRQRGYYGDRQREEVAESDDAVEVFSTNSRKGNANELLRFHFTPRGESASSARKWTGYRGSGGGHVRPRKTARYNKEQFLQASCQFIVRDDGEYSQQAMDPDALVKWEMVELVRTFSTESVRCPICLNVPYAGKITKCGHIFCWACMIRYLALGEKDYRKCPICYDAVKIEDLKSVQWVQVPDYKVGDTIDMKLMRKSKGSVYVSPKSDWCERQGLPHNFKDGENTKFSKLLVATKEQIQVEVIELEKTALSVQYAEGEEMEQPFISMAQELLKAREEILQSMRVSMVKDSPKVESDVKEETETEMAAAAEPVSLDEIEVATYADAFEDQIESTDYLSSSVDADSVMDSSEGIFSMEGLDVDTENPPSSPSAPMAAAGPPPLEVDVSTRQRYDSESSLPFGSPINPFPLQEDQPMSQAAFTAEEVHDNLELPHHTEARQQAKRAQAVRNKDTYYFYQAASGQSIYMHSVNARCLQHEYGSLENCPNTISATIVAIKRMFMTEDVRKRLRYLNHLPLTCEFHVVELNLKPPVLSKETLKVFKGDIEGLRRERQKRAREDKLRAKQNELEHRKAHGLYPDMNFQLDNQQQFPSHLSSSTSSPPAVGVEAEVSSTDPFDDTSSQPEVSDDVSSPISTSPDGQATADWAPHSATGYSPSLTGSSPWEAKSFAKIAGSGAAGSGVWPSAQRWRPEPSVVSSSAKPPHAGEDSDGDGEGHPAPSYTDSMAAAMDSIDIALRQLSVENQGNTPSKATGGKKKKKKEKGVPLFSTAMARKH